MPADGIPSQLQPDRLGENYFFSIWQGGQKTVARQAETDEQVLFATQNNCSSFICHKPAVGFLLCNKHPWRQDTWKREYLNGKTKEFCFVFFVM